MRLFKYFSSERVVDLQKSLIRFSQPEVFNDPFEFLPHVTAISSDEALQKTIEQAISAGCSEEYERLIGLGVNMDLSKDEFKNVMSPMLRGKLAPIDDVLKGMTPYALKHMYDHLNKNVGVLCLSEKNNDILMWAHYAESHKGFVVEFDSGSEFFDQTLSAQDNLRKLLKVEYSEKRPSLTISDITEVELFLAKSKHWEYEKEWRMVMPLKEACEVISHSAGDIYLFEYPRQAIRSIVFGARMQEELIRDVVSGLASAGGFEHVIFYKAEIHAELYEINVDKIKL